MAIDPEFYHRYEGCQDKTSSEEADDAQWVDKRAYEFIAKLYQQMKLYRHISLLQYNETLGGETQTEHALNTF